MAILVVLIGGSMVPQEDPLMASTRTSLAARNNGPAHRSKGANQIENFISTLSTESVKNSYMPVTFE